MTDRVTKLLLTMIAIGLWINIATNALRPADAQSQFGMMEGYLGVISSGVTRIEVGNCENKKIC